MDAPKDRSISPIQWGIAALTIVTAAIHIWLGLGFLDSGGLIFVLNGVGYLTLLALLLLPIAPLSPYRPVVRWVLIAYTAITVIAWILIGTRSPIAFFDKAVEIALIALLWLDSQQR